MLSDNIEAAVPHFWRLPANAALHGATFDSYLRSNLWTALALLGLLHLLLLTGLLLRRKVLRPSQKFTFEYLPLAAFTLLFTFFAIRAQHLWAVQRFTGAEPAAMQVEVTGMQFAWYFRYSGADSTFGKTSLSLVAPGEGNPVGLDPGDTYGHDDVVRSQLVLPVGREVDLAIRSLDVIHGFSVPELRLKQNGVPGTTVHVHFTPSVPGNYAILCTQVCGLGHYRMQSTLRILPQPAFDDWLKTQQQMARKSAGDLP